MNNQNFSELSLSLNKDVFLRNLLRELSGTLEDVIGKDEAAGYISIVGQNIAEWINNDYCNALDVDKLDVKQVIDTMVNLKERIDGDFYIISIDKDKVILGNRRCPFGEKVKNRDSLCMMTSNVFGYLAAENLGYSKVSLEQTIASGDKECRVVVYFNHTNVSQQANGREYFQS